MECLVSEFNNIYSTKGWGGIIAPNSLRDARQDIYKDKKCNLGTVAGY